MLKGTPECFLLIVMFFTYLLQTYQTGCSFSSSYAYRENEQTTLKYFRDFKDLEFNCSKPINITILEIKPKNQLILDNSLKFLSVTLKATKLAVVLILNNLKGFDCEANPFKNIKIIGYPIEYSWFIIKQSNFDFYKNGSLIDRNSCNENLSVNSFIFQRYAIILQETNKYSSELCPFLFRNAKISVFDVKKMSSSLIKTNILGFQDIKSDKTIKSIQSKVDYLALHFYQADLNLRLLNAMVFENINILDINGPLGLIQEDLFKNFQKLRVLRIRSPNIKHIFAKNNKWLNHINSNVNFDLRLPIDKITIYSYVFFLVLYQSFENVTFYDYPDEDFCYFKKFPHHRLVMPYLKPIDKSKCTCTEIYLLQQAFKIDYKIQHLLNGLTTNYYLSNYYIDQMFPVKYSKCFNQSFGETVIKCDFEKRLQINCKIETVELKENEFSYFDTYDWIEFSKYVNNLFNVHVNLILSVVLFFINMAFIFILSSKIIKEKMYVYLKLNATLNALFTLISISYFILNRFSDEHEIFLSSYVQLFNIVVVRLTGNAIKTFSNITYLSFCLARFITISNNKHSLLNKLNSLSIKIYILICFMVSFLVNVYIFFEYSIRTSRTNQFNIFAGVKHSTVNERQDPINDFKENFSQSEYLAVNICQYIKIIFSDFVLIIITILVDSTLFLFVKKQIKKRETLTTPRVDTITTIAIAPIRTHQSNNLKESPKKRILWIIILTLFNYILMRLPQAILSFYGFIFRYDKKTSVFEPNTAAFILCKHFKLCEAFENMLYSLFLLSFLVQFIIFYKLDKNFKLSLAHIWKKLKKRS